MKLAHKISIIQIKMSKTSVLITNFLLSTIFNFTLSVKDYRKNRHTAIKEFLNLNTDPGLFF